MRPIARRRWWRSRGGRRRGGPAESECDGAGPDPGEGVPIGGVASIGVEQVGDDQSGEHRDGQQARGPLDSGGLIIEALLLAAPTREMDGDVGGNLDPLRQDPHDPAEHLLLFRGRQFEISRDGR